MRGRLKLLRGVSAGLLLPAVVVFGGPGTQAGAGTAFNSGSALIKSGTVATAEAAGLVHQQFTMNCPADTDPAWVGDPSAPGCQNGPNGQLPVLVNPQTAYYLLSDMPGNPCSAPSTTCTYRNSTYEAVVKVGGTLRVGLKWARVNYNNY